MDFYIYVISATLLILMLLKLYLRLSTRWNRSPTCLIGKTAIVTGANSGIGFYTARDFATRGARVILACRNKDKGEEAKNKIIEQTGNTNVAAMVVDFQLLSSVRDFANKVKETETRLDILVNNAGAGVLENIQTNDGLNKLMQVNYFGPALLTLLLIDLLMKSAPSRIVNVASTMGRLAQLDLKDINAFPNTGRFSKDFRLNYANSKVCNVLFTNELARRLKGTNVTANSLHPGTVKTQIFRDIPPLLKSVILWVIDTFFLTPEEGAQTSIYVAVSKDIEGVSGEYYENCDIPWLFPMPKLARNEIVAKKVWEQTEKLLNLTPEEKQLLYL